MSDSVVSHFRAVADSHSDHVALSQGSNALSYHDLDRRTDALAAKLAKAGVATGDLVGMAGQRSFDTIIAALAILKAGAGYVPLPDYYSDDRIRLIAQDSGLAAVVGDIPALKETALTQISADPEVGEESNIKPLKIKHDPESVAYVMYTSGTTGVPKGVVVPHRGIIRLVRDQNFMKLGPDERILQNSPIAFDASTLEIWGALLNGGTLVLPDSDDTSLRGLGAIIRDQKITSMWLTAGLFHAMADERPEDFKPLRQLLTGGDVVSPDKVAKVQAVCPKLKVINGYGPTENTTFTCCHPITKAQAKAGKPLPIGKPINGTEVFVLDGDLQPVEDGSQGELCAAGLGLALGYLGQEALTNEVFVSAPWDPSIRLYRTGDLVERDKKGVIRYLGRIDKQVKVRGYRVELGGIETALEQFKGIRQAAAIARAGADGADKTLVGYYVADGDCDVGALREHLKAQLPDYAVPAHLVALDELPLNDNGKVDRKALEQRKISVTQKTSRRSGGKGVKDLVVSVLSDVLEVDGVDTNTNFFDLGASSLHIARVHERLQDKLGRDFPISDFFLHSTAAALADHLSDPETVAQPVPREAKVRDLSDSGPIAIVGLAGRYPGAMDAQTMWQGLLDGREMISHFTEDELDVDPSKDDPDAPYVRSRGAMQEPDMFDARHFGIPPKEAERLDPQHRILLEVAQTALENAGHDPARFDGRIGVFAGSSQNSYLLNNLLSPPGAARDLAMGYPVKDFATLFGNDKDFIATRVAYKLGLRGPAITVQCACSTSLVAVAQACQALQRGDADMALAGGVSVTFPTKRPYMYLPDGMASADGHCRTFDADATGTVFGDGAGLVVLRRLDDAMADGDNILAVIKGYAINNDGHDKAGYAAPSIKAQTDVIRAAHAAAGVDARSIGYIEAHGTATPLGDPIEFTALQTAFASSTKDKGFCALGSVKTNLGHLDIAAGVTGLIKTTLSLKNEVIPPLLHYKKPNPRIDFDSSAFFPVAEKLDWNGTDAPRRAGVSAFGVGGTNIHMVLEEAPQTDPVSQGTVDGSPRLFPVSASSPDALKAAIANLGGWATAHPDADPDRVIATLRHGRQEFGQRAVLLGRSMSDLPAAASGFAGKGIAAGQRDALAFLFPGQGAQHAGMARDLYAQEPVFREALGLCAQLLEDDLGLNLLDVIHASESEHDCATEKLKNTALAQPAIFSIGYALAQQWRHWGITPDVMVGHSIGEFAAATIAGVIALPDALKLIALRGRLMADLPQGVMISVRASESEVAPYLGDGIDLAAVNGAKACVVAGPEEAAQKLLKRLEKDEVVASRLHTSHAFHSQMMDPAVEPFRKAVEGLTLNAPRIPILSTVTGDWMTDDEATDPDYWAMHMRRPVRFYDAIQLLWAENQHIFLEAGPGRTMATLSGQNPDRKKAQPAIASLPAAQAENANSHESLLNAFGELWANGYPVDWTRIDNGRPEAPRLPGLPTYPFQRKRFWVEPVDAKSSYVALDATDDAIDSAEVGEAAPQLTAGEALRDMLSELSGLEPDEIDGEATFLELGFDSLLLTQATRELSEQFGVTVALRQLIDGFPNINALADHIEANGTLPGSAPAEKAAPAELTKIETDKDASPSSAPLTKIEREAEELTADQRAHIDALVARFTAKTAKSKALTATHRGTHADPRTASGFNRIWKELVYQIVTVKSKGSRLLDVDGNEYIDILNGFGPGFLGHSPDKVVEALHHQLDDGFEVGPQSLVAMEAAQLFCEVTGNDRASFVCTGSEAVYAAMRLARTVTNRDRIVMFARDYHGNFDEVLVRAVDGKDGPRTLPLAPGVPRDSVKNVIVLPYGTPQALDYIRKNADSLAAVIVEPVQSRRPEFRPAEFIREVRKITERSGSLFIFDEVVTGFRFGPRGAQAYYGVDADLITYGKVVGGGMPVGVVSGKARYMDTFDGGQWQYGDDSFPEAPVTFFAGTFVRHPLVMAALREMLSFFKAQPDFFWKTVNAKGDQLAGRVDRWFVDNDMPFRMPNCGSLMYLRIGEDQKFGALLGAHMRDRGVFLLEGFPSYMTAAHDDEDIDYVVDAFKDSALEMRAAGLITGREALSYDGPRHSHVPPRLSLPDGDKKIAAAMAKPLEPLNVPTTEAQREIFAAQVVTPEVAAAYNESVTLKIHGGVNRDALIEAVRNSFARHDALRSTFSEDGMTMSVHPKMDHQIEVVDLSGKAPADQQTEIQQVLDRHVETPFDMQTGPFLRTDLLVLGERLHHLVLTAHHIVCDGWSIDVIMNDISRLYQDKSCGNSNTLEAPLSIIDYARAQSEWAMSEDAKAAEAYWVSQFSKDAPVLNLPTDRPRQPVRSVRGARIDSALEPDLVTRLRKLAAKQNASFVAILLASFKLYLSALSKSDDLVVGVPSSGQASYNMDSVVGHCVNLLSIRTQPQPDMNFSDYLMHVRDRLLDGFEHQNYTYGTLMRVLKLKRDASRPGLVSVVFNIDNGIDLSGLSIGSEGCEFVSNPRAYENFELYLNVTDTTDQVMTEWSYNKDLFDATTIERHIAGFSTLLENILRDPSQPLRKLRRLSGDQPKKKTKRRKALGFKGGLPAAFHKVLKQHASQEAVVQEGASNSYEKLNDRSDQVARALRGKGIQKGDFVGLCCPSSFDQIVAMLGILKAGAGYVPLDPSLPAERLKFMAGDTGIKLLIGNCNALTDTNTEQVSLVDLADLKITDQVLPDLTGEDVAYVMYTSGSTGQPKGVVVPHRGILRLVQKPNFMSLGADERILQNSPIAFDAATLEIWGALLNGGALILPDRDDASSLAGLGKIIKENKVTTLWLTAGLFHAMADDNPEAFKPLRQLLTGGDVVSPLKAAKVLEACPGLTLINGYGPTENTTFTCCHEIKLQEAKAVSALPIGRPINDTEVFIVDQDLNILPQGETGELCAAGAGLSLGYLGQPDLTNEKFVKAPWDSELLLYRTGDLASEDSNGVVHYKGRIDDQVKIRGFRIELGEIETALESYPAIKHAAVVARSPEGQQDKVLIAYYVTAEGKLDREDLGAFLRAKLPAHAIPAIHVPLDAFPLNHNGKLDRARLPTPRPSGLSKHSAPPQTPVEEDLLGIWRVVLGLSEIGVEDDFFELGGHSLLAVRLFARIRERFGINLPISTLFQHPTARELASLLAQSDKNEAEFDPESDWDPSTLIHSGPTDAASAKKPLFIVGGVGGNVNNLLEFGTILGQYRPVIGMQTRGVLGHTQHTSIEAIARENIHYMKQRQPQGPYLVAGYSGGAFTAFEMARQLEAAGDRVSRLFVLDSYAPGFAMDFRSPIKLSKRQWIENEIGLMRDRGFSFFKTRVKSKWRKFRGQRIAEGLIEVAPELELLSKVEQNWMVAARNYNGGHLNSPASLFFAKPISLKEKLTFELDDHLGWGKLLKKNNFTRTFMDGTHLDMVRGQNAEILAEKIETFINGGIDSSETERKRA